MHIDIVKIFLLGLAVLSFSGCTRMIAVGEIKTYCQENGADFSDAGVCGDPYLIYLHSDDIANANNYNNTEVSKCR